MNTDFSLSVPQSVTGKIANRLCPEVRALSELSRQRGYGFQVLGQAPMLKEPTSLGDWLLVPAQEDTSEIPDFAMERLQALFAAGIRPEGFIVVHEAPKLLAAPDKSEVQPKMEFSVVPSQVRTSLKKIGTVVGVGLLGMALITGAALLALLAAAAASVLFLPVVAVAGVATLDPILVAVTPQGWWVEIARWDV